MQLYAFFRRSILLALLLCGLYALPQKVFAQDSEYISQFTTKITVNQNTSIRVEETIFYHTDYYKHGIYRYVPVAYNRNGIKTVLTISDIVITDENNQVMQYEKSYDGPFLMLKIGDPDVTFVGEKTYQIAYSVEKALSEFETHDELYWDITGEGWQFPILSTSAEVISPFASIEKTACFSGSFGGDDGLCTAKQTDSIAAIFNYTNEISFGKNMTISIAFKQDNQLIFPTLREKSISWIWHNWVLLLIPVPTLVLLAWWINKGRDISFISPNVFDLDTTKPTHYRPLQLFAREPFVYAPLSDLSPGQAGALLDEKVDTQDVVAEILDLARKKYLKLEVIEEKKWFSTVRDYTISKLQAADGKLSEVQHYLYTELFMQKDTVSVSELKGTFYLVMQKAVALLEKSLVDKKIVTQKPSVVRAKGMVVFFVLLIGTFVLVLTKIGPLQIFWPVPLIFLQIPVGLLFAYNLPQKTAVGTNLWLQARGLRKTIRYGKWREEIKEKNLFIEEVLPFAVSLGVINQLARHMESLNIKPPDYMSAAGLTTWNTSQFISGFSNEVASGLSYNPSSSSSGGSGFSGGSSGGGGGGGGGGSW